MLRKIILLLFFTFISSNCFSQEFNEESHKGNKIISKIIKNKIYIKTDSIKIDEKGIFLRLQGDLLPIHSLVKDNEGVYFDLKDTAAWDIPPTCPNCGSPWVIFYCSNPDCPNGK